VRNQLTQLVQVWSFAPTSANFTPKVVIFVRPFCLTCICLGWWSCITLGWCHSGFVSVILRVIKLLSDACTIMSYNILADNNAHYHPDLYLDVPWDAMRWDSRRRLIIREIRHWDPDLVCLQVRTQSAWCLYHLCDRTPITFCDSEIRRWIDSETLLQKWRTGVIKVDLRYNIFVRMPPFNLHVHHAEASLVTSLGPNWWC
jgi:hypothetical protein